LSGWVDHVVIAPIVVPLLAGTVMILFDEQRRALKAGIGMASAVAQVVLAIVLLVLADAADPQMQTAASIYRLGDWPSLFGIVLVLDRLSALMVFLTSVLGVCALLFSLARWHRAGAHFHSLFQFQLMGLNGAFLTGDLFNLFVFFEVMLAASYGLALHGSGLARIRAGLHYIVINLVASLLFLVGVSVIYGIAGTLNMADLAVRMASIAEGDRALLETGIAVLGVAFLIKAGMWPLGFWLVPTYSVASTASAAIISILSKVGVYALLRLWLLLFSDPASPSFGFGSDWLLVGGLLTIVFGSVSIMATQNLARLAGASILVSSGTLLAAIGVGQIEVTGGALFYLSSSVLAIAAIFLLVELVDRGRVLGADVLAVTREAYGEEGLEEEVEVGVAIPATMAILGLSFAACALLLAGLPPLSGFLGKFAMLAPLIRSGGEDVPLDAWLLLGALVASGFATLIATTRTGIDAFWASSPDSVPRVSVIEIAPVGVLLALCLGMTVLAGPVMHYMEATARSLHAPQGYAEDVLTGQPAAEPDGATETDGP
jgi:multicomponent K+:H+ antiporter subunit D